MSECNICEGFLSLKLLTESQFEFSIRALCMHDMSILPDKNQFNQ